MIKFLKEIKIAPTNSTRAVFLKFKVGDKIAYPVKGEIISIDFYHSYPPEENYPEPYNDYDITDIKDATNGTILIDVNDEDYEIDAHFDLNLGHELNSKLSKLRKDINEIKISPTNDLKNRFRQFREDDEVEWKGNKGVINYIGLFNRDEDDEVPFNQAEIGLINILLKDTRKIKQVRIHFDKAYENESHKKLDDIKQITNEIKIRPTNHIKVLFSQFKIDDPITHLNLEERANGFIRDIILYKLDGDTEYQVNNIEDANSAAIIIELGRAMYEINVSFQHDINHQYNTQFKLLKKRNV